MATAIIDMSDLVPQDAEPDPPRLQLGDIIVNLPPFMPASFLAAYSGWIFAATEGDDTDKREASLRLAEVVARLAPEVDGRAPLTAIASGIMGAYRAGEEPASSD